MSAVPRTLGRRQLLAAAAASGLGGALGLAFARGAAGVAAAGAAPPDTAILANLVVLEDQAVYLYAKVGASTSGAAGAASSSGSASGVGGTSSEAAPTEASSSAAGPAGPLDPRSLLPAFARHHADHRDAFVQSLRHLGGTVPPVDASYPELDPPGSGLDAALTALAHLEASLLGGLYGAIRALTTAGLAVQVASVFGVAARHQAMVLAAARRPPVPQPFVTGDPTEAAAVLRAPSATPNPGA